MNKIKTPKRDIQAEVTARILSDLELGTPTWVKPWAAGTSEPVNHSTGNAYSGINTLILWLSGYQSSRWATYKQAQALGGQVRKGERGTQIVVCKSVVKKADSPDKSDKHFKMFRHFAVFNLEQIDGLKAPEPPSEAKKNFGDIDKAEAILSHCGACVEFRDCNQAYYSPSNDKVVMPLKSQFSEQGRFYAVLFHELAHWTKHPSRLNRQEQGRQAYAYEELVAELSSSFLCAGVGIPFSSQHSAYIKSWIQGLKNDNKMIFKAASEAQKAVNYLIKKTQTKEV